MTMIEVTPKLYRGDRPHSFANLQPWGITRVINLQSGFEEKTSDTVYEHERAEDFGMEEINFHWSNIFPPTTKQVMTFLRAVSDGHKIYVHCHSGVDRTGFAIAVYRMQKLGWTFADAHAEFVECGRHWWFGWWKHELKKWERWL